MPPPPSPDPALDPAVAALFERGRIQLALGVGGAVGSLIALFAWSAFGPEGLWQEVVAFPLVLGAAGGVTLFSSGLKLAILGPYADLLPL